MHNLNIYPFCGRLLEIYFKPAVPAVVDLFFSPSCLPALLTVPMFDSIFSFSQKTWCRGMEENWILKALLMTEILQKG